MSKKKICKLNDNDNHLSLGNVFRIIKSISINPNSFLQSDLFCIIFNCESIGTSTVNNYCTGVRSINPDYKNYILKQKELYESNNSIFIPMISGIISLISKGKLSFDVYTMDELNNDAKLKYICSKLYTISKNDNDVDFSFSDKLRSYINNQNYYDFIVEVLFFTILVKVQPIYEENILIDIIEKNLNNTNISVHDVESFMKLQLNSGIWSIRGLNELANKRNPFACFEMASLEFYGIVVGKPRYEKAYEYYKIAADNNHPVATWAIGYLFYNGYIGARTEKDLETAYNYFLKSQELKCSSAFNSLGLIYLNGDVKSVKKDVMLAKELFKQGAELGNVYSFNNLGAISEKENDYDSALNYYFYSAELGDSWALNKIGEFYRLGIYVKKDLQVAYNFYLKSSECPIFSICPWSKYNLAKYFFIPGVPEIGIFKDINKAIELLDSVCNELIIANEELIYIYYDLYMSNNKDDIYLIKLKYYVDLIEKNINYNNDIKNRIEKRIEKIKLESINIDNFI